MIPILLYKHALSKSWTLIYLFPWTSGIWKCILYSYHTPCRLLSTLYVISIPPDLISKELLAITRIRGFILAQNYTIIGRFQCPSGFEGNKDAWSLLWQHLNGHFHVLCTMQWRRTGLVTKMRHPDKRKVKFILYDKTSQYQSLVIVFAEQSLRLFSRIYHLSQPNFSWCKEKSIIKLFFILSLSSLWLGILSNNSSSSRIE